MRIRLFLCLCMLAGTTAGQTLQHYLQLAVDSNAALRASYLRYEAARANSASAGALPDPEVSFGYFISPVETRVGAQQARISAMQMFPWFGTLGEKRDAGTELALARLAEYAQARNDLVYEVKTAYYQLYALEQSVRITNANLEILRTFESLATTRFESGSGGMTDVLRIRMEIAELENNLRLQDGRRKPLQASLNSFLGRGAEVPVPVPDTVMVESLALDAAALTDSVAQNNEQLAAIGHRMSAAEHGEAAARKSGAPSLGLGLNYIVVADRPEVVVPDNGKDAFMPMVSLRLPVYRGAYKARVREATYNREALALMQDDQRRRLRTAFELAWLDYEDAGRRLELYDSQIKTASQAQDILLESYGSDGRDFEEVLRMQRLVLRYELEWVNAVRDRNTAVAKIESLM